VAPGRFLGVYEPTTPSSYQEVSLAAIADGTCDGQLHSYVEQLLGSMWFEVDQHGGVLEQDCRLEGPRQQVAAFRQSVSRIKLARPAT
jgi:hypothetical protein